ncbi:hypothetical protein Hanom_Chr06g00538331 [Helianthus anomalus]
MINKLIKKWMVMILHTYILPEGLTKSFKASVKVKKQLLLEMQKEIDEDPESKKAKLEAKRKDN